MKKSIASILVVSSLIAPLAGANQASLPAVASRLLVTEAEKPASAVLVVKFAAVPGRDVLDWISRIPGVLSVGRLAKAETDYFRRAYRVELKGRLSSIVAQLSTSKQIQSIEKVGLAELFAVNPSNGKQETNDPLVNYQWGMKSNGQVVLKEIDDLRSEKVVADPAGPSMDVGVFNSNALLSGINRDVVVAVLDSGIDYEHPDLAANIYKNEKECVDGKIPFRATEDKDGNGLIGDCMGWDYSGRRPEGRNNTEDSSGHGTHVAGIMSAISGNGIGVAGISSRIKILPIKVTGNSEEEEPTEEPKGKPRPDRKIMTFADRIAAGILYAVKMKVDVINMSLGWPISVDAEFLREAFAEARKAGIVIVAAAGNNTSGVPVFPCSYEGVICVGSVNIDGQISSFSNYGGQVDVVAPGDEILSTYPMALDTKFFAVKGYDFKNGTSQAAPVISAQAALLRAMNPSISTDQVVARLAVGSKPVKWGPKYGVNGAPDIAKVLSAKPQPVVRPIFKSVSQVTYNRDRKAFKIALPIKNYWTSATGVKVSVRIDEKHLVLDQGEFQVGTLNEGEAKTLSLSGRILDLKKPREARLLVTISSGGEAAKTYTQQIYLTRQLENDSEVKTTPLVLLKSRPKLLLRGLRSVREDDAFPEFLVSDVTPQGVEVGVVRLENGQFKEQTPVKIPNSIELRFALRADLNYDGKSDYLFSTTTEINGAKGIRFTMLKNDFSPVIPGQPFVDIALDGGILTGEGLQYPTFVPFDTAAGKIAGFVFTSTGGLPKEDQNPDKLEFEPNIARDRVYFYEPRQGADGKFIFATRAFDNYAFTSKMRELLKLRAREDAGLAFLLPQTDKDFASGTVRMLIKIGVSSFKTYKVVAVNGGANLVARNFQMADIALNGQTFEAATILSSMINLDSTVPEHMAGTAFATFFNNVEARVSALSPTAVSLSGTTPVRPLRLQDHLMDFTQAYASGDSLIGFFQTKSQLLVRAQGPTGAVQDQQAIDRSSMIPDSLFKPFPITSGVGTKKVPALYMDSTLLLAKRLFVWTYENGKLTSPMLMNVEMPNGCQPLAPRRFGTNGEAAYVLLCQSGADSWAIKTLTVH